MSPVERFERYAERITLLNPQLNAFLDLRLDEARQEAEASAARTAKGEALSPIDGYCIGVKANVAIAGLPHHAGIAAYKDEIASADAIVVARLKAAGAIILGTLNMHEGALGATTDNEAFGRCYNPRGDNLTPGGSSGGSGAAMAADLCDMAIGSDTMGSVRIPAAYCGVQGHKPTTGMIPTNGVLALSHRLDHLGPLCRSVEMLAATLYPMADQMPPKAFSPLDLGGVRIGLWDGAGKVDLTEAVAAGFAAVRRRLEATGAELRDIEHSVYDYSASRRAGLVISEVEGHAIHAEMLAQDPGGFSDIFRAQLEWGGTKGTAKMEGAVAHVEAVRAAARDTWSKLDVVIAPTAPQEAFHFSQPAPAHQADFTAWANFARLPATAVFSGLSSDELPLSVQVIAPEGEDWRALRVAAALEQLFGAPPLPPGLSGL